MKLAAVLLVLATVAFAAGEFSTGGAELWKFKGWGTFRMVMYGQEEADPDMAFSSVWDLAWEPKLNDYLSARAELSMDAASSTSNGYADIWDAYLNLMPADGFCIRGGQFKRNIGWGFLESSTALLFPDRPLYTGYSVFGKYGKRDIGAMLVGDFDMFSIDMAYTNGVVEGAETDSNKQFTIHATVEPAEWATIGAGMGMYAADDTTAEDESFSSSAIDLYGIVNYPMSETMDLHFTGEYMMLGMPAPDVEGMEKTDGTVMTAALGATFDINGALITGITPMIRYETISPAYMAAEGADEPEDDYGAIDFCGNIHMGSNNVLQIGARSYSFQNEDVDGYTDIIVNWRMNF
ncbi:hypothetical protein GX411_02650 [Candidatus Fermentibacteria bacterium]|nr:hypothetical protein [Candidatus Fermentibacteria bacterium]